MEDYRLQMTFKALPGSSQAQVMSHLLNRERITASKARELISQALEAWVLVDAVRAGDLEDSASCDAIAEQIAVLEGRTAYCRSLLARLEGGRSDGAAHASSDDTGRSVASVSVVNGGFEDMASLDPDIFL